MIVNEEFKIVYMPCPKNGSSTFKRLFYFLKHGVEIDKGKKLAHASFPTAGKDLERNINKLYDYKKKGFFIFFISRDPVERFISGFKNRIRVKKDLRKQNNFRELCNHRQDMMWPSINTFVNNFDFYYENFRSIKQHFRPQVLFSSEQIDCYTEIFNMSRKGEIKRLFKIINSLTSVDYYSHTQKSPDFKIEKSEKLMELVKKKYSVDYEVFNF